MADHTSKDVSNVVSQPPASEQYAYWKRWPHTYREPAHHEWLREIERLQRELAEAREGWDHCIVHNWQPCMAERDRLRDLKTELLSIKHRLERQTAELRAALGWYAGFGDEAIGHDLGHVAREALAGSQPLAGLDAVQTVERLNELLKLSAEHAERHHWKCGLNPNPYAMKHMVSHCTCSAAEPRDPQRNATHFECPTCGSAVPHGMTCHHNL